MKIGYIHVDYEEWTDGSYNVQEIGLAKAFAELGHDTIIVYWVDRKSDKCFTEKNVTDYIKKIYLPATHIKHHVIFNCDLLKKYDFDLLHIQSDNLFYVPEITKWCRKNEIPYYCYVGTIVSTNPSKLQRILIDLITKRNIKAFKKGPVFAKTPTMAKQLKQLEVEHTDVASVGLDVSIIPEIPGGIEETRARLGVPIDKKIVLCVSALRESRRPLDIFELADCLASDFQIVFIGRGPIQNTFDKKLEQYPEIIYIPFVKNSDIHQYYYVSDYYVNFNTEEIFGMAILEAMYQNCTVVARHAPGPDYIMENGESGYLVNSIQEMADVICSEKTCGEKARQRIVDSFQWVSTAKKVLKIVEENK